LFLLFLLLLLLLLLLRLCRLPRARLLAFASAGGVLAAGGLGTWAALRGDGGRGTGARAGGVPRHTIGLHADLSGPGAALGRALERGAQLAVTEFNARTDRPFTLALRARDDAGRLDRAREVARQLGADKGVLAVIGPTSDAAASAVAGPYRAARLAVVSVSLGADAVAHVEYRNYLASRSADTRLILPLLAQVARRTRQHDRARGTVVGIIDDRNAGELSWQAAQDFATALTNNTYPTPPRTVTVARGATDVRAPVAELLAYRVDAIAYLGLLSGAVTVARELRRVGFDGDRLALQPVREPRFLREAGAAADGWYVSSAFVDASAYARTKAFAAGYRSRYGTAPPRYAAEAYDVVGLVARGLRDVAGTGAEREALIGRLPRTVYRGITKEFRFEPDSGTVSEAGLYLSRVVDGRFRFLGSYEEATKSRGG
ncbi:branched-chain amino acid ABC transporter substrate-binding protein, partial [Streptomyces sp. HSW2009]|uniref:branched-chain amino acid ABC transporter substrate-binding protein n=1 Tax=Streptomyces sp. HSW2009 TaxID=3142890 RepID=UPI0032EBB833